MNPALLDYRKILLIAALAAIVIFREYLTAAVLPFFAGLLLAGLIDPLVDLLEKRARLPRALAVLLVLVLLIICLSYILVMVFGRIVSELLELASLLPAYQETILLVADQLIRQLNELGQHMPSQVTGYLQSTIDDLAVRAGDFASDLIDRLLGTISALPNALLIVIIVMLSTFFFSKDRDLMSRTLLRIMPQKWRRPVLQAQQRILVDLIGFIKAQLLILALTTTVATAGLFLIGTRFWVILGLMLGILDLIPVLGPGLILFPWIAISLALGQPHLAAQIFILFAIILVLRQVAEPKLLGDSIGVHPLMMLIALYAGIVFFGFTGLIIGPLIVIISKAVWNSGLLKMWSREPPPEEPAEGPSS